MTPPDMEPVACRDARQRRWWEKGPRSGTEIHVCFWLADRFAPFADRPGGNRWLAGLHELFWTRACGHDWPFALQIARIYWTPRKESR